MRKVFTLLILCLAAFYTWAAFADLSFLSSTGRLGPGFFPRIIGVGLILASLFELTLESSRGREHVLASEHARTTLIVAGLTGLFVLSLDFLGGYLAMIAFLLASLTFLNRSRPVQNVLIAIVLPTVIFVMFEHWLNAALPRGMILPEWLV